jgi:hypothetical protein
MCAKVTKLIKWKRFFINFVTLEYILVMRNSLRMMYEHRNVKDYYEEQILLTYVYIVRVLDIYSKSLQNARDMDHDNFPITFILLLVTLCNP